MHARKRSAAFISDDSINEDLSNVNPAPQAGHDAPSKRLANPQGVPIPQQSRTLPRYTVNRLLNNLAFTRLYVTGNFQNWDPASSPVILCCVDEQNDLYRALCQMLPSLYELRSNLQALAMTAGYLNPNAMADQTLLRQLPMTTTAGLDSIIAGDFESFRNELGPGDCIAVIEASGICTWTSSDVRSTQELAQGLALALKDGTRNGTDETMPDG